MPSGEEYFFYWSESCSAFNVESTLSGCLLISDKMAANARALTLSEKRHSSSFISKTFADIAGEYSKKTFFDPSFREQFLIESESCRIGFRKFYERVLRLDLAKLSNVQLAYLFDEYARRVSELFRWFQLSQAEFTCEPHEALKSRLEKYFEKRDVPEVLSILLASDRLDVVKREELDLLKLALEGYDRENLEEHSLEYAVLFYNSYDKNAAVSFLEKRILEFQTRGRDVIEKRIREINEAVSSIKEKQVSFLEKIKDEQTRHLALLLRDLGTERFELKDSWAGAEYRFLHLLGEIANRLNVPFRDFIDVYRFEDVRKGLLEGIALGKEEIERRKDFYIFYLENGSLNFFSGNEGRALAKKLVHHYFEEKKERELAGVPASPGIARGRARVLKVGGIEELVKDLAEFQEGEVLVTTMTQPSMVLIVQKASAIVTNEGGITSHAAVLAREFGIPCIVGTKNATKVLKTGDLIVVDADRGVVQVIA